MYFTKCKLLQKSDASISLVIPVVTTILKELEISNSNEDHGVKSMKKSLSNAMLNFLKKTCYGLFRVTKGR